MGWVIGLDVHKDTIVAAALDPAGVVRAESSFDNTVTGHHELGAWVADTAPDARCGLEPSGGVGHAAAGYLQQNGIDVVLVPSRLSSREATRNAKRGKTDQGDAIAIARVVQREDRLPVFRSGGQAEDLKLLVDYRDQLHSERTRVANRLHADLSIAYPGYQRTIGRALTSRRVLKAVTDLIVTDHTVRADLARRRLARLAEIDVEMQALKVQLEVLLATTQSSLTDIVGVSTVVAARLIGEIGDIRRFPTSASFAAGNGTAPLDASSGRHERHRLNRGREPTGQPCPLRHRHHPDPPRTPSRRLPHPETSCREDPTRSTPMLETPTLRRHLPHHARRHPTT
jgi:transposase